MKSKFSRIVSFILALTLSVSMLAVFASAETEDGETAPQESFKVLLNRTFDEGWDSGNGFHTAYKDNSFTIDSEVGKDFKNNYFTRVEALNGQDGYTEVVFTGKTAGWSHTITEFDLKADDFCNIGDIMYARTMTDKSKGVTTTLLRIKNNTLSVFGNDGVLPLNDEWVHIAIDYDYTDETMLMEHIFTTTIYVTPERGETISFSEQVNVGGASPYLEIMRLGMPRTGAPETRTGTGYCFDNFKSYVSNDGFVEIPEDNYGDLVNLDYPKDIVIDKGDGNIDYSDDYYISHGLAMKVGVDFALVNDKKQPILGDGYGRPVEKDGNIYVSLEAIVNYIGYPLYVHPDGESFDISTGTTASYITLGRDTANVDGKRIHLDAAPGYVKTDDGKNSYIVISLNDVETLFPGYYVSYDNMGLIIICKKANVISRVHGYDKMVNIMKKFIFDLKDAKTYKEDIVKGTNNYQHPFLIANQDKFDELKAIYNAKEGDENYNADVKEYITRLVEVGEKNYRGYAKPTRVEGEEKFYERYIGLENIPVNPYPDTNGYDPHGGRLNESGQNAKRMMNMAFAYKITGDEKYLKCAYDVGLALGEWEHWGPAHFLNCADASYPFAFAVDWLYNDLVALKDNGEVHYNVRTLMDILYTHGTYQGYYSIVLNPGQTMHPRKMQSQVCNYVKMPNNWNAVCSSGIVIASIMTSEIPEYSDISMMTMENNISGLVNVGLIQYAPDGSYVESPGYWNYGTNSLFRMLMTLESTCKTDYGIFNAWGLDETCYFACHTESSDYKTFNYHDGGVQKQDCSMFFYVAYSTKDSVLSNIRMGQLKGGKEVTIYDVFYMPLDGAIEESAELPLSYTMEGIDAFTVRSSWDKGAMFAGIIGGRNDASHGQVDSGSWVYHNKGTIWIYDFGADEYNVYSYFSNFIRYRYYRMNAEGNNTLAMTSRLDDLPFGQKLNAGGKIVKSGSNEHGAFSIIDNTEVYGDAVTYARRGMLSTNDNKTVVIQDEVSSKGIESFYWFAHYRLSECNANVTKDGRTAYLTREDGTKIRLSIVSKTLGFKFEIMDCYTFVLTGKDGTVDKDFSPNMGGVEEKSREGFNKLAIKAENVLSFNLAVAIEEVPAGGGKEPKVGYEWEDMENWEPKAFEEDHGETVVPKRSTPKKSEIKSNTVKLEKMRDGLDIYGSDIDKYYRTLSDIEYAFLIFKIDELGDSYLPEYNKKNEFVKEYDAFVNAVNGDRNISYGTINSFMGI